MTATAKKIITPAQLTTGAASYYSVPAATRTVIKKLTFTNFDTVARTVTVYLVPSGDSPTNTNILTKTKGLAPAETWECFESEGQVLNEGDSIQALASAGAAINIQGSGVEIV